MDKTLRRAGQDAEKSIDETRVLAENGLANLWNMAASSPKLEIYRTDSYKSETTTATTTTTMPRRALENFCPVKIFSPARDGTEPRQNESRTRERKKSEAMERKVTGKESERSERDRAVEAAVKTSQSRRTGEFAEARFMDYRSSVRDLSNRPETRGELFEGWFPSNENCTLDENTASPDV